MRNRAKCNICKEIIESLHQNDYVRCKCGEIAVDGGKTCYRAIVKNWANFLRVDDNGDEIHVKVKDAFESQENDLPEAVQDPIQPVETITRKDRIEMLEMLSQNIQNLPQHARHLPVTNYEFSSVLSLLAEILREA